MHLAEARNQFELLEKQRPQQERAIRTYESILDAAAELLVEVGLERISTNLIAERAGITVPALYRYFPNKYSVLNALGGRLMEQLNGALLHWQQRYIAAARPRTYISHLYELLLEHYLVIDRFTGGLQIMHALQAIAPLQQLRLDSRWETAELLGQGWCRQFGVEFTHNCRKRTRHAVEMGYASVQLALEDGRLQAQEILLEGALSLRLYAEHALHEAEARPAVA